MMRTRCAVADILCHLHEADTQHGQKNGKDGIAKNFHGKTPWVEIEGVFIFKGSIGRFDGGRRRFDEGGDGVVTPTFPRQWVL